MVWWADKNLRRRVVKGLMCAITLSATSWRFAQQDVRTSSSREDIKQEYWRLIYKYQFIIKWLISLKVTSASQTILSIQIFVHLREAISIPTCLLLHLPERSNSDSTTSSGLFLFRLSQSTGKLGWCCLFGRARKSCRCTVIAPRLKFTNSCLTQTVPVFPLRWNYVFSPTMVQMQTVLVFCLMYRKIVCKFARCLGSRRSLVNSLYQLQNCSVQKEFL